MVADEKFELDEPTLADLERALRDCDGQALAGLRSHLGEDELAELEGDEQLAPAARVWARWERIAHEGERADRMEVSEFGVEFERRFGISPPPWWLDQLSGGKPSEGGPDSYDVGLGHDFDRRGSWKTLDSGGRIRADDAMVLGEQDGQLYVDLSSRRAMLGEAPKSGWMVEYARPRGGLEVYLATFEPGQGGFPFPIRKIRNDEVDWETRSCGTGRFELGGLGHLTVDVVVIDENAGSAGRMTPSKVTGVAVFSAESHGLSFELFDPETGERTAAFTSDLWSAARG